MMKIIMPNGEEKIIKGKVLTTSLNSPPKGPSWAEHVMNMDASSLIELYINKTGENSILISYDGLTKMYKHGDSYGTTCEEAIRLTISGWDRNIGKYGVPRPYRDEELKKLEKHQAGGSCIGAVLGRWFGVNKGDK